MRRAGAERVRNRIIPLTPEIATGTGIIKQPEISVADAIIAASTRSAGAAVVTKDPHFPEMGVKVGGYPG
jgi:predicted nucleic acid-binding protein